MFSTRSAHTDRSNHTTRTDRSAARIRRALAVLAVSAAAAATGCTGAAQDAARTIADPAGSAIPAVPAVPAGGPVTDDAPATTAAPTAGASGTTDTSATTDTAAATDPTDVSEAPDMTDTGWAPQGAGPADDPTGEVDPDGVGVPAGPITFESTGGTQQQPVHPEPEAPAPSWESVALSPIATSVPTQDLAPLPDPVVVPSVAPVATGAPGGLTSNLVGCASTCLTQATLAYQQGTPNLEFASTTTVAATVSVWIRSTPPVMLPQGPRYLSGGPTATSPSAGTAWTTQLQNLSYDTFYYVIVRATDQYGNSQWASTSVTTAPAPGPDQLTGNETGCAIGCISSAIVTPGSAHHNVRLAITTDTAAEIRVAVSTQLPGWIGSLPYLPEDEQFDVTASGPTSLSGDIVSLDGSTTYYVLVKATDVNGATSWAAGEFTTAAMPPRVVTPDDVFISFERVEILYDGDPQPGNRGEAELVWRINGTDVFGFTSSQKISDGDVIELPADASSWVTLEPGEELPHLVMNVVEGDLVGDGYEAGMCIDIITVVYEPTFSDICDSRTNVAGLGGVDVEWISTLMPCTWFLLEGVLEQDRCIELRAATMHDDYPDFKVLVRFRVD